MIRRTALPLTMALLAYGFWWSAHFQEIAAGVAIFLCGMYFLEEGFRSFTGGLLEDILQKATASRGKSLLFGIITTTLMQSSSLVSVITISFLSAGLIDLPAGIGIVFGANLGTTTGAWLIAGFGLKVKISIYAMPMLVFGVLLRFQRSPTQQGLGSILSGLGFLFLGIHHMKVGFESFQHSIDLSTYAVQGYPGVLLFTLLGVIATVIMQSSHATLVIIITALSAGQVVYENALALAIGANIGTTITAILGSIGANVIGKRLAAAHLIFKLVTAVITISFVYQLTSLVDILSADLGIAADDYTLKLALFHTLFNFIGVAVMLPFVDQLVAFLNRILPDLESSCSSTPKFLHPSVIELPETAIEAVRQETLHLYQNTFLILAHGLHLHRSEILSEKPFEKILGTGRELVEIDIDREYERTIKNLYSEILMFISQAQTETTPEQAEELFALRSAGREMVEAIKDTKHLRKNLTTYINSPNQAIRKEYNAIRQRLGTVMRQLDEARRNEGPFSVLDLDTMKMELKESDTTRNGTLEQLIREEKITPEMATSLMNDAAYAYDVAKSLVKIGGVLFVPGDLAEKQLERSLSLDQKEIDDLLAQGDLGFDDEILEDEDDDHPELTPEQEGEP